MKKEVLGQFYYLAGINPSHHPILRYFVSAVKVYKPHLSIEYRRVSPSLLRPLLVNLVSPPLILFLPSSSHTIPKILDVSLRWPRW